MHCKPPMYAQRGFTLLEVLIAALLVSSLAIVAAVSLNRSSTALHESSSLSDAQTVANNEVERVREHAMSGSLCSWTEPEHVRLNGVTYRPSVTLEFIYEDASGANQVTTCDEARAVRVHAEVTWDAPAGQDTLSLPVTTTISLVDLTAPSLIAFAPPSIKVAQGQTVELRWEEGDTLPIPEYTLSVPPTTTGGADAASVSWTGPSTWTGAPASKNLTIEDPDGADMDHQVYRDRTNVLSFTAQRNGVHTLAARNIVGDASAVIDANVVGEPSLRLQGVPPATIYGAGFTVNATDFDDGNDAEAKLVSTGPPNYPGETYLVANLGSATSVGPSTTQAAKHYPATYEVRVDNLYTDTYGHTPNSNKTFNVACYAPEIDVAATRTPTPYAGSEYRVTITILPNNVPDLVVTAKVNGTRDAVLVRDPYSGRGTEPLQYVFRTTAGAANTTEEWVVTATSNECDYQKGEWRHTFELKPVPAPDPEEPLASSGCSLEVTSFRYPTPGWRVTRSFSGPATGSVNWPSADDGSAKLTGKYTVSPGTGTETIHAQKGKNYPVSITVHQEVEYWRDFRRFTGSISTCFESSVLSAPDSWFEDDDPADDETNPGDDDTDPGDDDTDPGDDDTTPDNEECGWEIIDGKIVDTCR